MNKAFFSRLILGVLFTALTSPFSAFAFQNDGPYIRYVDKGFEASWVCDGKLIQQTYVKELNTRIPATCGVQHDIIIRNDEPSLPAAVQFKAKKLAAISDVHGQYQTMLTLLQKHGIINQELHWVFGNGHVVMTGDVFDRGDQINEILWLLYQLEQQAKDAGGALHLLLGNHEIMVMANDIRYVNKQYLDTATLIGQSYSTLYDDNTVIGKWLRSKPVVVQVNDSLFMHGGLHNDVLPFNFSIQDINENFRMNIGKTKEEIKLHPISNFLFGSKGPIWYRGYFNTPKINIAELEALLKHYQVKRMVVGHTTMSGVFSHWNGKVISIDADIKSKNGEILLYENNSFTRGTLLGERLPLLDYATANANSSATFQQ